MTLDCDKCRAQYESVEEFKAREASVGIIHENPAQAFAEDVARQEARLEYRSPYPLRELGNTFPEIDWLANLPPEERIWHGQYLDQLVDRYPNVPEWAWVKLLRKPNGSGRS